MHRNLNAYASGILRRIERGLVVGDETTGFLEDLCDEELIAQRQEPTPKSRNEIAQYRLHSRIQRTPVRVQERVFWYRLHGVPTRALAASVRRRPSRHYTNTDSDKARRDRGEISPRKRILEIEGEIDCAWT